MVFTFCIGIVWRKVLAATAAGGWITCWVLVTVSWVWWAMSSATTRGGTLDIQNYVCSKHTNSFSTHLIMGGVLSVIIKLALSHHLDAVQSRGDPALAQHVLEDGDTVVGLSARHLGVSPHGALRAGAVRESVLVCLLLPTLTRPGHCYQCQPGLWETRNWKPN